MTNQKDCTYATGLGYTLHIQSLHWSRSKINLLLQLFSNRGNYFYQTLNDNKRHIIFSFSFEHKLKLFGQFLVSLIFFAFIL